MFEKLSVSTGGFLVRFRDLRAISVSPTASSCPAVQYQEAMINPEEIARGQVTILKDSAVPLNFRSIDGGASSSDSLDSVLMAFIAEVVAPSCNCPWLPHVTLDCAEPIPQKEFVNSFRPWH